MNTENIEGGVSPLKAKRQSSRGGKHAGKATATSKRRGGYAKSKGKRGAGGRNVGGYNVQTRFQPRKTPTAPSGGGTTKKETPQKPYSFDEDGNVVVNNYITTTGGTQTQTQTQTNNEEKENDKIIKTNEKIKSGVQTKQDEDITVSKIVKTDKHGNVVKPEDRACNDAYIAKHGDADCKEYKAYRKKHPVDRSKRKSGVLTETREGGQKWKRTWTQKPGEDKVYTPWVKVN